MGCRYPEHHRGGHGGGLLLVLGVIVAAVLVIKVFAAIPTALLIRVQPS